MVKLPIYLDNQATTRVDPRVLEAMLPYFCDDYGNAASRTHSFGWKAEQAVAAARDEVAASIGAASKEIVFTSGATESNNLGLKGAAAMLRSRGNHIITVQTEHKAVLDPCKRLERDGFHVTFLPVQTDGLLPVEELAAAITDKTILVSVMAANNEIGVLQPITNIGKLCKEKGVIFYTDAAQAVGKIEIDVEEMGIDLLSISGHKIYGPKGVGALYVRRRNPHVRLDPQIDGGGHERGMRSGTLPVPLIVGIGEACQISQQEMALESERLLQLRERLRTGLTDQLDDVVLNGHPNKRLPGNLNVSFAGLRSEALLTSLRNIAVSSGSACTSASIEPSHVLRALGVADELAHGSIRFGLGRFTTEEEIDFVIEEVVKTVNRLRAINPTLVIGH